MTETDVSEWANFGVGVAGATAALTGLLFVAVSINLDRILQYRTLPRLAGTTLLMFSGALVSALLLLMPGQSPAVLGTELVVIALGVGGPLVRLQTKTPRYETGTTEVAWVLTRLLPSLLVSGLLLASGVTMWAEWSDALYLLGAGVTLAIVAGLVNSWVLLVEIQR